MHAETVYVIDTLKLKFYHVLAKNDQSKNVFFRTEEVLPGPLPLAPSPNSPSSSGTWPGLLVRAGIPPGEKMKENYLL